MLGWLKRLFEGLAEKSPPDPYWTPARVEAAIERAGRDEVFARARQLGWTTDNPPPLQTWAQIASQAMIERLKRDLVTDTERRMEEYRNHVDAMQRPTLH